MYLKKIIISGFKSFADKVTLNLDKHAITGVVGPNGSGKSNVIDAVRWVMGEQNAKMLRGEKSTDIIFSGSEKRKPQSMAEVSLVFDNSESSPFCPPEYRHESEIHLTRRIFLDGEREYYINRKPSRLRDIVSFFISSGLGGRSYSMIQQGQVDQILQAKPEQIREILEDASHISVFKKRREDTLKKLDQTKLNLSRIDDILNELQKQLDILSGQVEKAKKYQNIQREIKEKEVFYFSQTFIYGQKRLSESSKKLLEEEAISLSREAQKISLDTKQKSLEEELAEADPELAELNESISTMREKIASFEATLINTIKFLDNETNLYQKTQNSLIEEQHELSSLFEKIESTENHLDIVRTRFYDLQSLEEELTEQLEIHKEESSVFERNLSSLKTELLEIEKSLAIQIQKKETIEKIFSKSQFQEKEISNQILQQEQEYTKLKLFLDGSQVKATTAQRYLEDLVKQKNQKEDEYKEHYIKLKTFEEKIQQIQASLMETRAVCSSLEELIGSNADGMTAFHLMKEHSVFSESVGYLSQCFKMKNIQSDLLTEEMIGSFENWCERLAISDHVDIVFFTEIAISKEIPPVVVWKIPSQKILYDNHEHVFLLKDFIDFEIDCPRWIIESSILDCLFGSLEKNPTPIIGGIIFTPSGRVIAHKNEWIIGTNQNKGILSKKQKLSHLREKETQLFEKFEDQEQRRKKMDMKIHEIQEDAKETERLIFDQNKEVLKTYTEHQEIKNKTSYQEEKLFNLRKNLDSIRFSSEDVVLERNEILNKEKNLEIQKENIKKSIDEIYYECEDVLSLQEERRKQLENTKIEFSDIKTKESFLQENLKDNKNQQHKLQEKVKIKKTETDSLLKNIESSSIEKSNLEEKIQHFLLKKEELEHVLSTRKDSTVAITQELKKIDQQKAHIITLEQKSQKLRSDLKSDIEKSETICQTAAFQLAEVYQIKVESEQLLEDENFKPEKTQKDILTLKHSLDHIGPVNMIALDEYEEISDRKDFISKQKEEILCAIDLLETAIDEIEDKSTKKFLHTFQSVNHEFKETFPILFPRGEAQLHLMNESRPLESGVEIMVRLPGKARQNMRLFSGGEKALTAIALIFALLKSKPTPFCFLDEVDAPLDETNVGRYNDLLQALSHRFQFIVITHRRKTMEVLDLLYGVTMQEPGVSKVVGVDLGKALPPHLQKAFQTSPTSAQLN